MLKELLLKIAKEPFAGKMIGSAFRHCSWAIPAKKVYSSKEIIAFYHPRPSYENHIIISPKRAIRNLQQMATNDGLSKYFAKIWEAAEAICTTYPEYEDAYVLVANGGRRQEVQQIHFHMFTNHEIVNECTACDQAQSVFYRDGNICILEHPDPNWDIHFLIKPNLSSKGIGVGDEEYFGSVLRSIDVLNARFDIVQKGYSLVYQCNMKKNDKECPVFHIVSGQKHS